MAIGFRSAAASWNINTPVTSFVVGAPAGIADGDLLLTWVSMKSTTNIITRAAGWGAASARQVSSAGTLSSILLWKIASSEPSTWTHTSDVSVSICGTTMAYSGVDQNAPFGLLNRQGYGITSPFLVDAPPDNLPGQWTVFFGASINATDPSWTSTQTERIDNGEGTGSAWMGFTGADSAGITNPAISNSFGVSTTPQGGTGVSICINPPQAENLYKVSQQSIVRASRW